MTAAPVRPRVRYGNLTSRARDIIRWAVLGIDGGSIAGYIRSQFPDGDWRGDACGCSDDRCKDGFHHDPHEDCQCLDVLLGTYVCGLTGHRFAGQEFRERDYGRGLARWECCQTLGCTAAHYVLIEGEPVDVVT